MVDVEQVNADWAATTMLCIASGRNNNVVVREVAYKLLYVTLAFTFNCFNVYHKKWQF